MRRRPRLRLLAAASLVLASAPLAGARAHVGTHTVTIDNSTFSPEELRVDPGETVTWANIDDIAHRVVADDGSFSSPVLGQGDTFDHHFPTTGWFGYRCSIHAQMTGVVVVGDAEPPPPLPPPPPAPVIQVPTDVATVEEAADLATEGTVIEVLPGTYPVKGPIVLAADAVVLRGTGTAPGEVVLEAAGAVDAGVRIEADGVTVANLTVRHFRDDGVLLLGAAAFTVTSVVTEGRHARGVRASASAGGVVQHVVASGPSDAGVVVEHCRSCGTHIHDVQVSGGRDGVRVQRTSGVVLSQATATAVSRAAVLVAGSAGVDVAGARGASGGYGVAVAADRGIPSRDVDVRDAAASGAWADLAWDGLGLRVCFSADQAATSEPPALQHRHPCGSSSPASAAGVPFPVVTARLATA